MNKLTISIIIYKYKCFLKYLLKKILTVTKLDKLLHILQSDMEINIQIDTIDDFIKFCEDENLIYISDCLSNFEYTFKWYAKLKAYIKKILCSDQIKSDIREKISDMENVINNDIIKIENIYYNLYHLSNIANIISDYDELKNIDLKMVF